MSSEPELSPESVTWPLSKRPVLRVILGFIGVLLFASQLAMAAYSSSIDSAIESLERPVATLEAMTELERLCVVASEGMEPHMAEFLYGVDEHTRPDLERDWDELIATLKQAQADPDAFDTEVTVFPGEAIESRQFAFRRWDDPPAEPARSLLPAFIPTLVRALLVIFGFVLLLQWWRRGRPDLALRERRALMGFGLRRGLWAFMITDPLLVLMIVPVLILEEVAPAIATPAWSSLTLLTAVPALALVYLLLLRPTGQGLADTWGWDRGAKLLGVALALFAIDSSFETVLGMSVTAAGHEPGWWMFVDETMLFGSDLERGLSLIDAVIGAAIVEELVFRGVLFGALRERMTAVPAALISGLVFGVVHGYEPVGLVIVSFSGFAYAMVYERTNSLAPGILVHAVSNLLASAGMLTMPLVLGM